MRIWNLMLKNAKSCLFTSSTNKPQDKTCRTHNSIRGTSSTLYINHQKPIFWSYCLTSDMCDLWHKMFWFGNTRHKYLGGKTRNEDINLIPSSLASHTDLCVSNHNQDTELLLNWQHLLYITILKKLRRIFS